MIVETSICQQYPFAVCWNLLRGVFQRSPDALWYHTRMIWRHAILLTLCLALCAVAASYFTNHSQPTPTPWSYADLRLLDPVDADQPTRDLLAVYTRIAGDALEIRLDLLEHAAIPDYDLYLALDTGLGGGGSLPIEAQTSLDWDTLLVIPAFGEMQTLDSQMQPVPGSGLRVVRDPVLDQTVIGMGQVAGNGLSPDVQIFVTPAGKNQLADQSDPVRAGNPPPPPARVLLAFWNAYPAYTPATTLRRWNGAHTGPLGGSHGLLHLLRAARSEGAPLALLDLKYPTWLSALDFIGGLDLAQQMEQEGLLIIPEYLPDLGHLGNTTARSLKEPSESFQRVGRNFGLHPNPARFTQQDYFPASTEFPLLLADLTREMEQLDPIKPVLASRWRDQRVIPIRRFAGQENQAQSDGPSLEARKALSQAAMAAAGPGGEAAVLVLGGELPESAWGAPAAANATLHYLKSRPWIRLLSLQDLLALQTANDPGLFNPPTEQASDLPAQDSQEILEALSQAPDNSFRLAAWEAFQAEYAPVYPAPEELPALRANYRGQVWSLLAAAGWAEQPAAIATCETDPDRDGHSECILASEQLYAQFEIDSGTLSHLFLRDKSGGVPAQAHQIIGPSSQIISGLSDPKGWKINDGLAADPAVIPGAFAEAGMGYQPVITGNTLTFTSADRTRQKTYQLTEAGLRMAYRTGQSKSLQIPLLLDPWRRFTPGWSAGYHLDPLPSGWRAWLESPGISPLQVELRSNVPLSAKMYNEASALITRPEDPNQDYPSSFFLPFPLSEIKLSTAPGQDTIVEIKILD